ncbi:MAG: hypothetical protein IPL61_30140 [Myxococcales bacterium]|nr:hypothetical protein [Myxococcales bacterium]
MLVAGGDGSLDNVDDSREGLRRPAWHVGPACAGGIMLNHPSTERHHLVLMLCVFACACGGTTPAATSPTSQVLEGRARTVTFECSGADPVPKQYPMTCAVASPSGYFWTTIEPLRELAPGKPIYDPIGWPLSPCMSGIALCGTAYRAPEGSHVLACRAADQRFDGPVEVVAPDGSLLLQGYCVEGDPAGTWFDWKHGELARTWSTSAVPEKARAHDGVRYIAPGTYTYGKHKLVPLTPVKP